MLPWINRTAGHRVLRTARYSPTSGSSLRYVVGTALERRCRHDEYLCDLRHPGWCRFDERGARVLTGPTVPELSEIPALHCRAHVSSQLPKGKQLYYYDSRAARAIAKERTARITRQRPASQRPPPRPKTRPGGTKNRTGPG